MPGGLGGTYSLASVRWVRWVREVRREAANKRADLGGGKPKKNGLYKEISLRYRFFWKRDHMFLMGLLNIGILIFFGDPLVLGDSIESCWFNRDLCSGLL